LPRPILARSDLLQIANARDRINAAVEPSVEDDGSGFDPSQCRVGGCGRLYAGPPPGSGAGSTGERTKPTMEEYMSVAGQAFILTGELFVLSFVAIYAFWFADKLRRNFFGQP
jgi:hypothetical protein